MAGNVKAFVSGGTDATYYPQQAVRPLAQMQC